MTTIQWIKNLDLLTDNLRHLAFELESERPNWFRIAKEAYQALCRVMVEALRGSANLQITGRFRDRDRTIRYHIGDQPWREVRRQIVTGCEQAWRYSQPVEVEAGALCICTPPKHPDDGLAGFFDLLAMIQTECFMSRFTNSSAVAVTDQDMRLLEWLHLRIRNEFEHFMPKFYGAPTGELEQGARVALELAHRLVHESGTIIVLDQQPASALAEARRLVEARADGRVGDA